ncbi:carbohydrate ABC transporter permease [Paenibacillus luteus]|uniref:carbohydrate ABC transporter permease n=1 Tax=Paenibacillus luteus TaxID=2545753 RepID=UPI0011416210|nr:carbohydrate ABC transporter permease [Paenibacillus luteus]
MTYNKTHQTVSHIILMLVTLAMIVPLLLLFISSVTDEKILVANGYSFFPEKLSFGAYEYISANSSTIFKAYGITIVATAIGTVVGLLITGMMGFALSIKGLPGKSVISFFVFFTMLFNGGLVPSYIMWTSLGIVNSIWAYVIPFLLTNAFSIILIRSYFASNIPNELYDSAKIDGAGYFRIFMVIGLPLGKPILVTIGLFACLNYWNDWQNGLYFISDPDMLSIQALLNKMNQNMQAVITYTSTSSSAAASLPHVSIRMGIAFVAILPILVMYPFLQKYFASGIMGGAVKG